MNQRFLSFGLLLPVALPLLLAGLALLVRSSRMWIRLLFAGFLLATLPLLPLPIFPKETPVLPWLSVGSTTVPIQLSISSENGAAQSATAPSESKMQKPIALSASNTLGSFLNESLCCSG